MPRDSSRLGAEQLSSAESSDGQTTDRDTRKHPAQGWCAWAGASIGLPIGLLSARPQACLREGSWPMLSTRSQLKAWVALGAHVLTGRRDAAAVAAVMNGDQRARRDCYSAANRADAAPLPARTGKRCPQAKAS